MRARVAGFAVLSLSALTHACAPEAAPTPATQAPRIAPPRPASSAPPVASVWRYWARTPPYPAGFLPPVADRFRDPLSTDERAQRRDMVSAVCAGKAMPPEVESLRASHPFNVALKAIREAARTRAMLQKAAQPLTTADLDELDKAMLALDEARYEEARDIVSTFAIGQPYHEIIEWLGGPFGSDSEFPNMANLPVLRVAPLTSPSVARPTRKPPRLQPRIDVPSEVKDSEWLQNNRLTWSWLESARSHGPHDFHAGVYWFTRGDVEIMMVSDVLILGPPPIVGLRPVRVVDDGIRKPESRFRARRALRGPLPVTWAEAHGGTLFLHEGHPVDSKRLEAVPGALAAVNLRTATMTWETTDDLCSALNFTYDNDVIYCGGIDKDGATGLVRALDAATGATLSSRRVHGLVRIVLADAGNLYVRTTTSDYVFAIQ